jgi:uncharacterized membrane protein YoaK (UPF0700 family)
VDCRAKPGHDPARRKAPRSAHAVDPRFAKALSRYAPSGESKYHQLCERFERRVIMADELTKPTITTRRSALEPGAVDHSRRAQARSAELSAAALATIAGFIDAYGMITYGVFVSFMSGNTTQTGYQTADGAFGPAALPGVAILFFVAGSFAGTLLVEFAGRLARPVVFAVVAAALAVIVGSTQLGSLSGGAAIAAISLAMGIMNSAFSHVGAQSVSLTFVTGTLSRVGSHLALAAKRAPLADAQGEWDTHLRRAMMLARLWAGFLAGALLSGAATPRLGAWVLLAPALVLAAMAAFDRPDHTAG